MQVNQLIRWNIEARVETTILKQVLRIGNDRVRQKLVLRRFLPKLFHRIIVWAIPAIFRRVRDGGEAFTGERRCPLFANSNVTILYRWHLFDFSLLDFVSFLNERLEIVLWLAARLALKWWRRVTTSSSHYGAFLLMFFLTLAGWAQRRLLVSPFSTNLVVRCTAPDLPLRTRRWDILSRW